MNLIVRNYGVCDYLSAYDAMVEFNRSREMDTADEIWFMQHDPVYTLGMAGKHEHILNSGEIPVIKTDRGGQVTYHGPGQLLGYVLFDLKRNRISIRGLVEKIEQAIIEMLRQVNIDGERLAGAPGVYVENRKIAALGIRVRNGCSYHGFSLNVNMDLHPYLGINPCGYPGMEVTQMNDLGLNLEIDQVAAKILPYLCNQLGYQPVDVISCSGIPSLQVKQPA